MEKSVTSLPPYPRKRLECCRIPASAERHIFESFVALLYEGMNDLIAWLCLQLGASGCYLLSPVEKMTYVAGMAFGSLAAALLLFGALVRIFTR